jgi:hypothetical protein
VHFDVVFSGQSPLIGVTFGFSGKFKLLQNNYLVQVFFAWRFRFFGKARVSSVKCGFCLDTILMYFYDWLDINLMEV